MSIDYDLNQPTTKGEEIYCCRIRLSKMKIAGIFIASATLVVIQSSCDVVKKNRAKNFRYENFKSSALPVTPSSADTMNAFEANDFSTENDSGYVLFHRIDTLWNNDLAELKKIKPADKAEKKVIRAEVKIINCNIKNLASFLNGKSSSLKSNCSEKECPLVAEIVKEKQLMYLYIGGELKDSFAVSTGIPGRETPNMNMRVSGPVFTRYTSTKYPEGDYKGLGNMPYAVFVKSGYAIHGTTQGNFAKLGKKASHGCIRLHPDNARLFYDLVKIFGLNNTWVIVR